MAVTEDQIHSWIKGYPRDWDQLCQALMWQLANRFGTVVSTPPSAIEAYQVERSAGRIKSGTPPPGAFVYWDIGQYGHVGFTMNNGRVFMATSHLAEEWTNTDAGWNTLNAYTNTVGATYLGWSYQNGGNTCPFSANSSTAGGGGNVIGADVADYTRFQNSTKFAVRSGWQRFPTVTNPRSENLAAGTGGTGLYDLTLNLYLSDFFADAQIEGRLVLAPTGGKESPGYTFTLDGTESGVVKAAIPAIVNITKAASLFFELRKIAGAKDPNVTLWGADVLNLTVG